jgi:hypothetical protein
MAQEQALQLGDRDLHPLALCGIDPVAQEIGGVEWLDLVAVDERCLLLLVQVDEALRL